MRKLLILAVLVLALLSLSMPAQAAATVNFNVKWIVDPVLIFKVGYDGTFMQVTNGASGTLPQYSFTQMTPSTTNLYENHDVNGSRIQAWLWTNDAWNLDFSKPALISDNDNSTVNVQYNRRWKDQADANFTETGWQTGNDNLQSDMGAYAMEWDLKITYNYWHTRSGIYENTFTFTVTQL